ncbi:MAG: rod-binding protein [Planctomycetota bacterium]
MTIESVSPAPLSVTQGRASLGERTPKPAPSATDVKNAEKVQEAFRGFVGATVFGQMLGSMRGTVGEPAYFHGGQAEKVFQSQLDQAIADHMTSRDGAAFADSLFEHQFPDHADTLHRADRQSIATVDNSSKPADRLQALNNLRRT